MMAASSTSTSADMETGTLMLSAFDEYPSVVERYFRTGYKTDVNGRKHEDICILQHSNKVLVVTLAKGHPIMKDKKVIKSISFQVTKNINRLDNKVSGKGKKGGQWVNETSPLCIITCDDSAEFTIYSCVNGKLVEVNENLLSRPQLLTEKPSTDGYIAIILPKFGNSDPQMEKLLTEEKYMENLCGQEQLNMEEDKR